MKILISRHGNTFGPQDKVVYAGATNDLPLVQSGIEQAERLANYLNEKKIKPTVIYCSKLIRTYKYAQIIIEKLGLNFSPTVDSRLHEIDYGKWTGLSNDEVKSTFGEKSFEAWENESRWPQNSDPNPKWGSTEYETIAEIHAFTHELIKSAKLPLVITSNGKLRYFLTLVEGEWEKRIKDRTFKVKTGNLCQFDVSSDGKITLDFWNQKPN